MAATLRERALADDTGWKVVESLTTEIGPRLAGSEADATRGGLGHGQIQGTGFRQGVDRAGDVPEVGATQRTARRCSARMRNR